MPMGGGMGFGAPAAGGFGGPGGTFGGGRGGGQLGRGGGGRGWQTPAAGKKKNRSDSRIRIQDAKRNWIKMQIEKANFEPSSKEKPEDASGAKFAEFGGVDPSLDPELAMAMQASMREDATGGDSSGATGAAASGMGAAGAADSVPPAAPSTAGMSAENGEALAMNLLSEVSKLAELSKQCADGGAASGGQFEEAETPNMRRKKILQVFQTLKINHSSPDDGATMFEIIMQLDHVVRTCKCLNSEVLEMQNQGGAALIADKEQRTIYLKTRMMQMMCSTAVHDDGGCDDGGEHVKYWNDASQSARSFIEEHILSPAVALLVDGKVKDNALSDDRWVAKTVTMMEMIRQVRTFEKHGFSLNVSSYSRFPSACCDVCEDDFGNRETFLVQRKKDSNLETKSEEPRHFKCGFCLTQALSSGTWHAEIEDDEKGEEGDEGEAVQTKDLEEALAALRDPTVTKLDVSEA